MPIRHIFFQDKTMRNFRSFNVPKVFHDLWVLFGYTINRDMFPGTTSRSEYPRV